MISSLSMKLRLKQAREGKYISQQQLADRSKVAKATIVRLERADFDGHPNWVTLQKLADGLGVDVGTLIAPEP